MLQTILLLTKSSARFVYAALQGREVDVTAGVAACAVGAMTSLLLLVIVYTDTHTWNNGHNDGQNDQSRNLLQCSLRSHLAEIKM